MACIYPVYFHLSLISFAFLLYFTPPLAHHHPLPTLIVTRNAYLSPHRSGYTGSEEAATCHINKGGKKKMGHMEVELRECDWQLAAQPRPPFDVCAGKWPGLAVTCLWLMSTGQWFGWQRLQPCSKALSLCSVRVLSRLWQTRQDSRRVEPG